nr:RNA-directed DNA polymerase, eukaryota, reverse transcriptase zinc-binding domain protein [Tanacetum cinerariifolium]
MNKLTSLENMESSELVQKAKVKWSIEGDENSKFFHGIINKCRNNLAIRGIMVDGDWMEDPAAVKKEFFSHFQNRFEAPCATRLFMDMEFPNRLSSNQALDLERHFSKEEIKGAIWDCGLDKSPGPDGFTFGFYRRYLSLLEYEVVEAMNHFYNNGFCQKGGNSSFIALIPKTQGAKSMVHFEYYCYHSSFGVFFRASGLRINLQKSKLKGVAVENTLVTFAANNIGCMTLSLPFSYLGVNVGGHMSRIASWDVIINKVLSRLSKWKMKVLSVGGRLTLLKSMLGSTPIYYMSLFKAPVQMMLVKWNNVLASKEMGGLGVSSFYALNRALIFNWVWRFRTQGNSIWTKVIKALHGEEGNLDWPTTAKFPSNWLDIIRSFSNLYNKGVNLLGSIKKKVGNGENTMFWDELWKGEVLFKNLFPRLYALESVKNISVADKMAQPSLEYSFRCNIRGGAEQVQMALLLSLLEGLILPNMIDRWMWSI